MGDITRQKLNEKTDILDYGHKDIQKLVNERKWKTLDDYERIGAVYDFVRNEIKFGYNRRDEIRASEVLADGFGQCNTKATLLMALFRAVGIPCRLHGFTIKKILQSGVVPQIVMPLAPANILHSWVEIYYDGKWINLEGFILDDDYIQALQRKYPDKTSLCAYGAGTDDLQNPGVRWVGTDTYIQKTGINQDFGIFDSPDDFYKLHTQKLGQFKTFLYQNLIRHWMNRRVSRLRNGHCPKVQALA
ncbi:MAG: transglutaminase-like domain-containing protein [Robiginitomaculum sp.]|nr:transglutaminase-like domain-containing protein [Robiginitomaculum sp.]